MTMRRWRKDHEGEDELLTFDNLDEYYDEDDEEDEPRPRRKVAAPRAIRTRFYGEDHDDDEEDEGSTFEDLEPLIRAGKYKPKKQDPYTAHILYQNLQALGEI